MHYLSKCSFIDLAESKNEYNHAHCAKMRSDNHSAHRESDI